MWYVFLYSLPTYLPTQAYIDPKTIVKNETRSNPFYLFTERGIFMDPCGLPPWRRRITIGYTYLKPVWPDLANFRHFCTPLLMLWPFIKFKFSIWQNFELIWTNFICYWANFNCCKWPNIEQSIRSHFLILKFVKSIQRFCIVIFLSRNLKWINCLAKRTTRVVKPFLFQAKIFMFQKCGNFEKAF